MTSKKRVFLTAILLGLLVGFLTAPLVRPYIVAFWESLFG